MCGYVGHPLKTVKRRDRNVKSVCTIELRWRQEYKMWDRINHVNKTKIPRLKFVQV